MALRDKMLSTRAITPLYRSPTAVNTKTGQLVSRSQAKVAAITMTTTITTTTGTAVSTGQILTGIGRVDLELDRASNPLVGSCRAEGVASSDDHIGRRMRKTLVGLAAKAAPALQHSAAAHRARRREIRTPRHRYLAPANLERLFDAFYTTKPGGLGMGLSICRSIVEAHGGQLWATANVPRGAIFQFTLPAHPDSGTSA
jgi:hypothetical protein